MKPSGIEWIGDIPDDWEVTKISRLYSIQLGKMLQPEKKSSGDTYEPYICAANLSSGTFRLDEVKYMWISEPEKDIYRLKRDNLLVTEGGDVGISSIWKDDISPCYFQNALHRVVPKKGNSNKFLHYWLIVLKSVGYIDLICNKSTIAHFTKEKFAQSLILSIPLQTQQKIADYLDEKCGEIDATIAKQKESIEKLKAYKQSLISETVTKGLDKSAPLKPSGIEWIGDIPSHWEIKKLKFVANFNQNTLPEDTDGQFELKYIDIANVSSVDGIKEIQYFNFSNAPSRARRIVKYGDIIVSTVRTYLRAITSIKEDYDNCICSTGFAVITPKDNVQQDFVVYAIENESFIAQIIANSQGISYPAINVSQLENLKLAFPSVKEQKEIVDFLKTKLLEIDSIINKKQNIIQKLDTYKKSLIFEYVTGKKYV